MPVKYYAVLRRGHSMENPSGIARRRIIENQQIDEILRPNLTWQPDSAIIHWEYGDVGEELVEISEEEAEQLIERFREKWGAQGG